MAVVKDCAYGCGARTVAKTLESMGVDFFAVARTDEAKDLRSAGIVSPVLVLGPCAPGDAEWASDNRVSLSINDVTDIRQLDSLHVPLYVHINIDTGMRRMGVSDREIGDAVNYLASTRHLRVEGLYTHFSSADVPDTPTVETQIRRFTYSCAAFKQSGISPAVIHCSNSAAIARCNIPMANYVRPGIALYGCSPDPAQDFNLGLVPVASLKAGVVKIKKVPAGTPVSYGGHYVTNRETFIATVPIGYGHGLPRILGNRGCILVNGKRYRIAGNVTMDYVMLDAGEKPAMAVGDEAVAMGRQGDECIHPDEIALMCNTIGYEILCNLSRRIERVYIHGGSVVSMEPGLLY
jgi:alanine racemase